MYKFYLILFLLILFLGCESDPSEPREDNKSLAEKVAIFHGVRNFSQIEELQYTFHAKLLVEGKTIEVERSWTWRPHEKKISYQDAEGKVTYTRDKISEDLQKVDAKFINDRYWLVYPFHLVWDDVEIETLPVKENPKLSKLVVKYPDQGGYTPGDIYELLVDENHYITQWTYRAGGSEKPTRVALWENYRQMGPFMLCLDFPGPKKEEFRVWFTNVRIKLQGQEEWVTEG